MYVDMYVSGGYYIIYISYMYDMYICFVYMFVYIFYMVFFVNL
jgi:hypothetical protein